MSRESVDRPAAQDRSDGRAGTRTIWAYVVGLVVSLTIALVVILTAIDVQSARIPDSEGHGWPFSRLFGPDFGSGLNIQGWTVLTTSGELTPDGLQRFQDLLVAHVSVDAAFALVYTLLLIIVIRAVTPAGWWRRVALAATAGLLLADLVENVFASLVAFGSGGLRVLLVATTMKWVLVGVVARFSCSAWWSRAPPPTGRAHGEAPPGDQGRGPPALLLPAGGGDLRALHPGRRRDLGTAAGRTAPLGVRRRDGRPARGRSDGRDVAARRLPARHRPQAHPVRAPPSHSRHPASGARVRGPQASGHHNPHPGRGRPAALDAIKANAYFGIWLIPPIAALIGVILTRDLQ